MQAKSPTWCFVMGLRRRRRRHYAGKSRTCIVSLISGRLPTSSAQEQFFWQNCDLMSANTGRLPVAKRKQSIQPCNNWATWPTRFGSKKRDGKNHQACEQRLACRQKIRRGVLLWGFVGSDTDTNHAPTSSLSGSHFGYGP